MHFIVSLFGILLTLFFVIGTHEAAHFIAARLLGVKVLRFSIGFGKTLFRWHDHKKTEYVIALVPLGGYVKMLDENEGHVPANQLPYAYNRQPFYKKSLIVLAGPLMNLFCAFWLYWLIFVMGFITIKPMIGEIDPQSIAARAGLKSGQEIVSIDQQPTRTWTKLLFQLVLHTGNKEKIIIAVKSNQQKITTHTVDLTHWQMDKLTPDPLKSLGIKPYIPMAPIIPKNLFHKIQYEPVAALSEAWQEITDFTYFNLLLFGKLLTGKISLQSLGGPITIFENAGEALNSGLLSFISFLAFLSIAIGVINLLPIPGLDGGHLLIQSIEFIIRKPLPEKILLVLYRLGFFVIFILFAQALFNDILRL